MPHPCTLAHDDCPTCCLIYHQIILLRAALGWEHIRHGTIWGVDADFELARLLTTGAIVVKALGGGRSPVERGIDVCIEFIVAFCRLNLDAVVRRSVSCDPEKPKEFNPFERMDSLGRETRELHGGPHGVMIRGVKTGDGYTTLEAAYNALNQAKETLGGGKKKFRADFPLSPNRLPTGSEIARDAAQADALFATKRLQS